VSLTVTGPGGTNTATRANLISVTTAESVQIMLEAEQGELHAPMAKGTDASASAGQFVWVRESS